MYAARSVCPVCTNVMVVTHLECRTCGSQLSGAFELPLLSRLSAEQMRFVEVMIKQRGSINRVADELGIAYSAGRAQLDDIIAALGLVADQDDGDTAPSTEDRKRVLSELAEGTITSEQAIKKLRGRS